MPILYQKHISLPIEKIILGKKKKTTYYLTANLFYSGIHFAVRSRVVSQVKEYLKLHLEDCPKFEEPISISIGYQTKKKTFDLDNKAYFWSKIINDFLQTEGKLEDDNVKFIQQIHYFYREGEAKLIFQVNSL